MTAAERALKGCNFREKLSGFGADAGVDVETLRLRSVRGVATEAAPANGVARFVQGPPGATPAPL